MNSFELQLDEVVEGSTRLLVPKERTKRGPGTKAAGFYNDAMRINRDLAVMVVGSLSRTSTAGLKVLDGLAATGAMGVRLANEVGNLECVINDRNELAFQLIKKNIQLNRLTPKARAENMDLQTLLGKSEFDYVDLDPYGSPIPFLDDAFKAVRGTGYMGITATDKAPLCGVYPKACRRKYDSASMRTAYSDEIGLRILLGYCSRTAARYGKVVRPLLSYSHQHHFRVYLKVDGTRDIGSEDLSDIGFVHHDRETGERLVSGSMDDEGLSAGPLWTGPLMEMELVNDLRPKSYSGASVQKMLELWKEEAQASPLFYTTEEISKRFKLSPPPMTKLMSDLRERGFKASRTHFSPTGFKTDAGMSDIETVFRT